MGDLFMYEKIYNGIMGYCEQKQIKKVSMVSIIVNNDTDIDKKSLLEYLRRRNGEKIGRWTKVQIERQPIGNITAIIKSIA